MFITTIVTSARNVIGINKKGVLKSNKRRMQFESRS